MLDQALALRQTLNTRTGIGFSLTALGDLAEAQQEFGQAKQHYQHALTIAQETSDRHTTLNAQAALGRIARYEGDLPQAFLYTQQSLDL